MADVTVITPIAERHLQLFEQARASVEAQTVPVVHLFAVDEDGQGPASIRNRLLYQVDTPFVTFLDADDWAEPSWCEDMLLAWRPRHYVFTDWYQDDQAIPAPDHPWTNGTFHLVSALIKTKTARRVGGFDPSLTGMEDTEFWMHVQAMGICGRRLARPLVHYRANGGRAAGIHQSGEVNQLKQLIGARLGGLQMGCCNDNTTPMPVTGDKQPGDVLCQARWHGNRVVLGRATGRFYPRASYPMMVWIDPRDLAANPNDWLSIEEDEELPSLVTQKAQAPPKPSGVQALTAMQMKQGAVKPAVPVVKKVDYHPDLAGLSVQVQRTRPVFVRPAANYPSYADFWRLVELSGFEEEAQDRINLADGTKTYVFVTPEAVPDCSGAKARTIFWQLEYTGLYTDQANRQTCGETWACDHTWAYANEARCVLLGSHPNLATYPPADTQVVDLCMLAYMTPRRSRIKALLADRTWPVDYPGHEGPARHSSLIGARLMLHVHQNDTAANTPLRYALYAAYRKRVLAEDFRGSGDYPGVQIALYDDLVESARIMLDDPHNPDLPHNLYEKLCVEYPFERCVREALQA